MTHTPTVVIVDGFSSGGGLVERARARGYKVIHIQSSDQISAVFLTTKGMSGDEEWIHDGNLDALVDRLRAVRPLAVLAGADLGVPLTDALNHHLGLRGNPIASSASRRNKYDMIEALHRAGLRAAAHTRSADLDELRTWVAQHGGFPKVVKPGESCASDGVTVCHSADAFTGAVRLVLEQDNKLGFKNQQAVVQDYLDGPEFFFDTVSADGVHLTTEWGVSRRIELPSGAMICNTLDFLPFEDPRFAAMRDYYFAVLDALELRNGPSHGELRWTAAGPVLIEVNPRPAGAGICALAGRLTDYDPFDAMVDAAVDPDVFHARVARGVRMHKHGRIVLLISKRKGDTLARANPEIFRSLASYVDMHWYYADHENFIEETVDLFTCPGLIKLAHEDLAQIDRDEQEIRRLEPEFYARMLEGRTA